MFESGICDSFEVIVSLSIKMKQADRSFSFSPLKRDFPLSISAISLSLAHGMLSGTPPA